jgi:hypothetical protein
MNGNSTPRPELAHMRTTIICVLLLAVASPALAADDAVKVTADWDTAAMAKCRRSSTVEATKDGVTLVDRDLIRYETGATVHAADRGGVSETVTDTTWIRKDFVLKTTAADGAVLSVNHSGDARGLEIVFNGKPLPFEVIHTRSRGYSGVYPKDKFPKGHNMYNMNGKPFQSHWRGGWQEVKVDPKLLKVGTNTVIVRAKKGKSCRFWIEQSIYPNRSAVSRDGGKTWDYDRLSSNRNLNGEYVIRLLLRRYAGKGWVESEPVDLWPKVEGTDVAAPAVVKKISVLGGGHLAPQTRLVLPGELSSRILARVGPTPAYDPKTWTAWTSPHKLAAGDYRYAQWRVELLASTDHTAAPTLKTVRLIATVRPKPLPPGLRITDSKIEQPEIVRPSHVFVHAKKTRRLTLLREQAKLDELLGKHPRGVEQLRQIARWINSLKANNNGGGKLGYMPTWDGLLFWNFAKDGQIGRMCTTRGAFFVQCATAMGYPTRPLIWSHAIAEVWIDDLGKWVAFDPSSGHYYEVDGAPAGMLEASKAWKNPKIKVRRVWNSKTKSKPLSDRNTSFYTRFFIPMRSNFLESDEPREPAHGSYSFKYDGHLRWLHAKKKPLPWFNFTTSRTGDIAFTCNTVNLHLARTSQPNTVAVQLETDMPNLARFEARQNDGEWKPVKSAFTWTIQPGENKLEVRGVNTFGLPGRPARAVVTAEK